MIPTYIFFTLIPGPTASTRRVVVFGDPRDSQYSARREVAEVPARMEAFARAVFELRYPVLDGLARISIPEYAQELESLRSFLWNVADKTATPVCPALSALVSLFADLNSRGSHGLAFRAIVAELERRGVPTFDFADDDSVLDRSREPVSSEVSA